MRFYVSAHLILECIFSLEKFVIIAHYSKISMLSSMAMMVHRVCRL